MPTFSRKYLLNITFACSLLQVYSCQSENRVDPYNEINYREIQRGKYKETDLYQIILQNKTDTHYTLIKMFKDSLYDSNFYIQHFEYKGLMKGPMENFFLGKTRGKHYYKAGKRHGESITLRNDSTIAERRFYDMGKKVGIWEFYDSYGKVFKKKYYKDDKFFKARNIYS